MFWFCRFEEFWSLIKTFSMIIPLAEAEFTQFGVLQCRDFCFYRFGCTSVKYSLLDLSCQPMYTDELKIPGSITIRTPDSQSIIMKKVTDLVTTEGLCSNGFKLFRARKGKLLCRKNEEHTGSSVTPRILIFSQPKRGDRAHTSVYQMVLPSLELSRYRYIYFKYPVSAVYIASYQTLVIARSELVTLDSRYVHVNCKLKFFHVDSKTCFRTETICAGSNMAVDESQGLLFIPSTFPLCGIMVITMEEKDLKMIVQTKSKPECITVDESRSRIYLSILGDDHRKIVEYYYNGTVVDDNIITKSFIRSWISFESNTDALYFQIDRKIHMFFPGNASRSFFKNIEYAAVTFHIFRGDIYFIPRSSQDFVGVLRKNGTRDKMYLKDHESYDKTTCLVM